MLIRILLSVLVAVIVGLGAYVAWTSLNQYNNEQIERVAASESKAARNQLVRNIDEAIALLENARRFWSAYGSLRNTDWGAEVDTDMAKFDGVLTLLFDDPQANVRFSRTEQNPVFDYRPDEAQWLGYRGLLQHARQVRKSTMAGPFLDGDGKPYFEIYMVGEDAEDSGRLIAIITANRWLKSLLRDASPGYAVEVFWDDTQLFKRGEAATEIPAGWRREGEVRNSLNVVWKMVHTPTSELTTTFKAPAVDLILLLGLVIAVLMGTLTFENWRAFSRARAAELAEQELAELNRSLEQEVASRTMELANRNADLQVITDSVGHDLRNPLNTIAVNLELFKLKYEGQLAPQALAILQRIPPGVRQMAEILDRLLGLSTVAHKIFEREDLDMRALASEVFEELSATETQPPVKFEVTDLPPAKADEVLVKVLFTNLFSNALKFTREKSKRHIKVDFEARDSGTVYTVTDNGIGFDQQSAQRLFMAFERSRNSGTTDGLGLGLSIVARVVERHGGRIWAESVPGEKAVFLFTLQADS